MGVFLRFMGSPDCKDLKNAMEEVNFRGTGFKKETFKRGVNQVPRNLTSSIAFFKSLQSGLPMNLKNTPMPRISYPQEENPEKKNFEKKKILKKKSQFFFFFKFFFSQDFHHLDN